MTQLLQPAQLHRSKSAKLEERMEGSHLRAVVQFVAVAGIRISFQLLAEIPGIFFFAGCTPSSPLKVISPLVALSPPASLGLFIHKYFQKCVSTTEKRDLTTVIIFSAFRHTFRLSVISYGSKRTDWT